MDYVLHIVVLMSIYSILAVSLDLQVGQMGLVSISQAAFYGIGAYALALTAINTRSFLLGLLVATAVSGVSSLVISMPSGRLRGDYLFIGTFAFQLIVSALLNNLQWLTGGPLGISGIPAPAIGRFAVHTRGGFAIMAVLMAVLMAVATIVVVRQIMVSAMGRDMRVIRDDEILAKALGKNTSLIKATMVAISAGLAGLAGAIYASYTTYIDPSSFTFGESLLILSMVIIGGAGRLCGPILGAAILVLMPEVLRVIGFPSSTAASLRQIAYGALLVILMFVRPSGILGRHSFRRR